MDLIQNALGPQFDRIRELERRCGIARSCDDDLLLSVGMYARRTGSESFDQALNVLTAELEALADTGGVRND